MNKIELNDYITNSFTHFDLDWALLTAGTIEDFNSMTISWGGLGTLWGKSVAFLFVKPTRYTYEFLMRHDEITITWFAKGDKRALKVYGSKSGRDTDRAALTGLVAQPIEGGVTYQQAKEVMVCQKLFMQQLDKAKLPAEALKWYPEGTKEEFTHYLVIAEVKQIVKE